MYNMRRCEEEDRPLLQAMLPEAVGWRGWRERETKREGDGGREGGRDALSHVTEGEDGGGRIFFGGGWGGRQTGREREGGGRRQRSYTMML